MAQEWAGAAPTPFETPMTRVGRRGLDLASALDAIDPLALSRLTNMISRAGGVLEVRPGQTALATTSGTERVHSLFRLNDPAAGLFTRLAGSATSLYRGTTGALTSVDTGYSGDPLTFMGGNAPVTGVPYAYIGDRTRNRKISRTGTIGEIGLAAAAGPLSVSVNASLQTTNICQFETGDPNGNSAAGDWTLTAGAGGGGAPTAADSGAAVNFTMVVGGATAGYSSILSIARSPTVVLTEITDPGGIVATDEDFVRFYVNVDRPDYLERFTVYFVCSTFTAGVIPGTSTTQNTNAFFKTFRPNELTNFLEGSQTVEQLGDQVRDRQLRELFKQAQPIAEPRVNTNANLLAQQEVARGDVPQISPGRNAQTVFGAIGLPLRRGDFARLGNDATATWATITGVVIVVATNTNQAVVIGFDDMYLAGGAECDTAEPTSRPYDYRYVDYDTETGVKGNPSPILAETLWVDTLRQPVTLDPPAKGASKYRQMFFRRGGSPQTTLDWYYVGMNSSDGQSHADTRGDDEILAEETLELDNYQPVPSEDSTGAADLAQPVPVFFRVGGYAFALGDTNQPQRLYRSKLGNFDAWPDDEYEDVSSASDDLMNGREWAGGGYVFSRTRLYQILLNDLEGTWTTEPTGCQEGMVGRWGIATTPYGLAFVSPNGIRLTQGSVPQDLSDSPEIPSRIGPLFRGETVNGYLPVDFTVPTAIQLEYHDNDLWFAYQDSGGTRRHLIYNFLDRTWRSYLFGEPCATAYSEPVQGAAPSLLLGGNATGQVYTHSGFSDDGAAIAYAARTGSWDWNDPYTDKLLAAIRVTAELQTATLTCQAFLNTELTSLTAQTVVGTAGEKPYTFEAFGTTPQQARNVAVELRGDAPTGAGLYFNALGVTYQPLSGLTFNEPTPWEELPGGEGYLTGCIITCDTANASRSIVVEYTLGTGAVTTAATLTVQANGRKKLPFSWAVVKAGQVRLRPTGTDSWTKYKVEWLSSPEPPRISKWDSNTEPLGDSYYTGLTLDCDTFGSAKTVEVYIDGTLITTLSVVCSGRRMLHFAFGATASSYGKVYRFVATDANVGLLYGHKWHAQPMPAEISNWDQGYTDEGDPGDKYIAGVLLECDTNGAEKPVDVYIDETLIETLTVQSTGRTTQAFHFSSGPILGKIMRLKPRGGEFQTDAVVWTGDGTSGRVIPTTISLAAGTFVVMVHPLSGVPSTYKPVMRHSDAAMTVTVVENSAVGGTSIATGITAFSAAGFTVGNHAYVNDVGQQYIAFIFYDADGTNLQVGTYTGDGSDGRQITVGWLPTDAWIWGRLTLYKNTAMASGDWMTLAQQGTDGGLLTAFNATGFTVQSGLNQNRATTPYYWIAMRGTNPMISRFTGTGTGSAIALTGFGFTPSFVYARAMAGGTVPPGFFRGVGTNSGSNSWQWTGTGELTTGITSLDSDGATLGTGISISSRAYHGWAIGGTVPIGRLFATKWLWDKEPDRTAGFAVQNWSILGAPADKYVKGVILEVDTSNVAKTVLVERDGGTLVSTLTVTANGRQVLQFSFAQTLSRVLRLRATDTNPGKLYGVQWIFDTEPLALARWETQERPFAGMPPGLWQKPVEAWVTLKSTAQVDWALTSYGSGGTSLNASTYNIATTGGAKQKVRVNLNAAKGLLFKHLLTSSAVFTLYKDESVVLVEDWRTGEMQWVPLFPADDDRDPPRPVQEYPVPQPGGSPA